LTSTITRLRSSGWLSPDPNVPESEHQLTLAECDAAYPSRPSSTEHQLTVVVYANPRRVTTVCALLLAGVVTDPEPPDKPCNVEVIQPDCPSCPNDVSCAYSKTSRATFVAPSRARALAPLEFAVSTNINVPITPTTNNTPATNVSTNVKPD
jgi:hypothetical protein